MDKGAVGVYAVPHGELENRVCQYLLGRTPDDPWLLGSFISSGLASVEDKDLL